MIGGDGDDGATPWIQQEAVELTVPDAGAGDLAAFVDGGRAEELPAGIRGDQ